MFLLVPPLLGNIRALCEFTRLALYILRRQLVQQAEIFIICIHILFLFLLSHTLLFNV